MGLVNATAPDNGVLEAACELAAAVARNAPGSLALTKRLFLTAGGLPLEAAMRLAVDVNVTARTGPELGEGVRAFLEKRSPGWRE